jgi:RimJ/RimL family protein N-acetyltransferase
MGVYVRDFKPEDALAINGILEPGILGHSRYAEWAAQHKDYGPAFTGIRNGEIIGCGGIMILWEGTGEAWATLAPATKHSPKDVFYCLRKGLEIIGEAYELIRIQAIAKPSFPESVRLLRHLGFEEEGVLRKYWEGGIDAVMMAKVK